MTVVCQEHRRKQHDVVMVLQNLLEKRRGCMAESTKPVTLIREAAVYMSLPNNQSTLVSSLVSDLSLT